MSLSVENCTFMGGEKPAPYDSYEPATRFFPLFNTEV